MLRKYLVYQESPGASGLDWERYPKWKAVKCM